MSSSSVVESNTSNTDVTLNFEDIRKPIKLDDSSCKDSSNNVPESDTYSSSSTSKNISQTTNSRHFLMKPRSPLLRNRLDNLPDDYTIGTSYTQEKLLEFNSELPAPTVTVTKGSKSPEGYFYVHEALEKGVPVAAMTPHPTVNPQPGESSAEYPTPISSSYYLENILLQDPPQALVASQTLKTGKSTLDKHNAFYSLSIRAGMLLSLYYVDESSA